MSEAMQPAAAGPGHNNPPSELGTTDLVILLNPAVLRDQYDLDYAELVQRVMALLAGVDRFFDQVKAIGSEEEQARASDFAGQLKLVEREVEAIRAALALPFRLAQAAVQAKFKAALQDPLNKALSDIEAKMTTFAKRLILENKQRLDDERRAAQAEASRLAAEAERTGRPSQIEDAAAAAAKAEVATVRASTATSASLGRVRGNLGTVATVRTEWTYEIADINDVPLGFLMVDDAAVRAVIAEGRRDKIGAPGIPGLRIIETTGVKVRA